MKSNKISRIYVSPNFKKKIKTEAANLDISIIKYTEILANKPIIKSMQPIKKKKRGFLNDFNF